ncbi:NDMA-dependent alcohol dehydrogenase [Amycolatopsis alkalitolerans]|uniref:NDMA-dependent alcohol dehydrogenase n=1 Tax=Amycolatopsis alkalitolerans TaxID=2547244 RepID=A0A5C4LQ52_9PSEU|nr:NDMA-dependent alcohol dehydrogenase [Amycolatopsis alkalitolerans]TNC18848.1 NDMA-dependent alcohol dehydrogenase [Amycolatopsis alkalitolerans]
MLTTQAAVLREAGPDKWWAIEEVALDEPKAGEVLVRFEASGLCHSDDHIRAGDTPARLPMVGGHEGAGVVERVGPGVTRVAEGDHIVCSFIPVCGKCRYCSTGRQNLCDAGLNAGTGKLPDGTFRFHSGVEDLGGMCVLGTFSEYAVLSETSCVPYEPDVAPEVAALVGCGVTTGWGSAVYAAGVRAGQTVVIFGIGGVGINAVQGAQYAGAKNVIAIDPVPFKLEMAAKLGATHTFTDPAQAREVLVEETRGQLADHVILTVGVMTSEVVRAGADMAGKDGQITITGVGKYDLPGALMTLYQRKFHGALFGGANPLYDIPRLLDLYRAGQLKLDELITHRYRLGEVNDGYRDMLAGKNIRGVIGHG